jgi:long-chain acyl-CoA synthetase
LNKLLYKSYSKLSFQDYSKFAYQIFEENEKTIKLVGRSTIFVELQNKEISLEIYICLIGTSAIPLFISEVLSSNSFIKMVKNFRPDFFLSANVYQEIHSEYSIIESWFNMNLYISKNQSKIKYDSSLCSLVSTSGSTGNPKLIPQTYDNIYFNTKQISDALLLNNNTVALASLPLSYTFGMSVVNCQLFNNAEVVACNFELLHKETLKKIEYQGVNLIAGVPLHFQQLINSRFFGSKYSKNIKNYLQAGGALSDEYLLKLDVYQKKNSFNFYVMYGQAEATTRITIMEPKRLGEKINSVGKSLNNIEITIRDNNYKLCKANTIGNIYCKGPNICPDYINTKKDLSLLKSRPNNDLETGDIGFLDIDNYLFITGRKKRFAKVRGISINLDDIEVALESKIKKSCAAIEANTQVYILVANNYEEKEIDLINEICNYFGIKHINIYNIEKIPLLSNGKKNYQILHQKLKIFEDGEPK